MKQFFSSLLLALICFSFTQDTNLIAWTANNKLNWTDFKSKPDDSSPYKAFTESLLKTSIAVKGNEAFINIYVFFDKDKSWVKEDKSDKLLEHEQVHFDITEVGARKFRQKLKGKTYTVKTFQQELNNISASIYKESKEMQILYDKETEHSNNAANQQKWNTKIKNMLISLSQFSATEVNCTLSK